MFSNIITASVDGEHDEKWLADDDSDVKGAL